MAMSPLVLDDEEAAAAEQTAANFRPEAATPIVIPPAQSPNGPAALSPQAPVMASLPSSPRQIGEGDSSDQVRRTAP